LGSDVRISDLQEFVKDNCRTAKIKNITKDISSSCGKTRSLHSFVMLLWITYHGPAKKAREIFKGNAFCSIPICQNQPESRIASGHVPCGARRDKKTAGLSGRRSVFVWCGKWGLAAGRDFYESTAAVPHSRVLGGGNRFSHYHTRV
jgi:hypothetical protein